MKLLVYSAKAYETPFLDRANKKNHKVVYTEDALDTHTAIQALGFEAISIFSGDDASSVVLEKLWTLGVRHITLRSAGHNNIQIRTAKRLGFKVANVPNYSTHAIAEHAIALLLCFNRKIILANQQVHNYNFSQKELIGFNLHGKTVGIIGTGKIGSIMVKIMHGFGCKILAHEPKPDYNLVELYNVTYVSLEELCSKADIISLHIPLNYENHHLINAQKLGLMQPDTVLINTSRGAVVDTKALIDSLAQKRIKGYCTDVYENEKGTFFKDKSQTGIKDDVLKELLSFSNVLLTPHQAFMTPEALHNIATTTFENIDCWTEKKRCENELDWTQTTL